MKLPSTLLGAAGFGATLLLIGCQKDPGTSASPSEPPAQIAAQAPPAAQSLSAAAPTGTTSTTDPKSAVADRALERPPHDAPRVFGKSRNVWIRSGPTNDTQWLGYLWLGGSVKIREEKRVSGPGCSTPWVPVEPRGWVCVDGDSATTDPDDPVLVALYPYRPRVETPWPHDYAAVNAPLRRYEILPPHELQKAWELSFERHIAAVKAARGAKTVPPELGAIDPSLVGRPAPLLPALPTGLSEGRTRMVARSALAYAGAFDHDDRAFLLAPDMTWVPRDRVELLNRVEFQGLALQGDVQLPLAFFRGRERPAFEKKGDEFVESSVRFERLSHISLTGEVEIRDKTRYYKIKGRDLWVSSKEAVVPEPKAKTPWGADVGAPDTTGLAPGGRATWIEVSILGGWLVAFEGTRPVYVTMISPGRGGIPHPDKDPLETASTPTGRFPIGGKFKTATMESSSSPILHSDVPWTQNFSGPHAIHSAYWHDDWGSLKSAGCVNVATRLHYEHE